MRGLARARPTHPAGSALVALARQAGPGPGRLGPGRARCGGAAGGGRPRRPALRPQARSRPRPGRSAWCSPWTSAARCWPRTWRPAGLQRAAREARRLIQDLEGDRLGLIAFAGRSYILAPLTVDGGAIRMYLDALDPDLASEGGSNLAAASEPGRASCSAPRPTPPIGCWCSSPTARRTTRCRRSCAQAEALKDAGIRAVVVAEGRPDPARIPIRDSAGTLTGVQAGRGRQCGPDPAAGRRAPRHGGGRRGDAGAERAAGPGRRGARRGRRHEAEPVVRDPNRRPRAPRVDSGARGRASCSSATPSRGPVPRWSGSRAPARRARLQAQRPTRGRARHGRRRPGRGRGRIPEGGEARHARATPPSTTPAPPRWRPAGSTSPAARWSRRRSRSIPSCAIARSTTSASCRSSPPGPTPPAPTSCWTTRPSDCARRCCSSPPRRGPSGTWS